MCVLNPELQVEPLQLTACAAKSLVSFQLLPAVCLLTPNARVLFLIPFFSGCSEPRLKPSPAYKRGCVTYMYLILLCWAVVTSETVSSVV